MTRPTRVRYLVLAALCVVTVVNYVQRNSIGSLVEPVVRALETDDAAIGLGGTLFFVAYALLQIPTGKFAQWTGPRRALAAFTVGWSMATAAMALATGVWGLNLARTLMGALQAGIFPCATLVMVAWLPVSQRAFASAILNSCMLVGGAVVYNLTAVILAPTGPLSWRTVLVAYSIPGFLWAAWWFWWFRDKPDDHGSVNQAERELIIAGQPPATASRSTKWIAVLLSATLWLICVQQFMRAGANRFTDQWLARYFEKVPLRDLDDPGVRQARAKHFASAPNYGGVIGGLIGGFISDAILRRTGNRRAARNGVAVVSLGLTIVSLLPVFFVSNPWSQVVFFTLGSFISAFAAPCAYALSMDVGGKNLPVVFGAMNMVGNFGAAAITGVTPLLNRLSPDSWRASLILFVSIHAIALVCWLLLNPNRQVGEST